MVIWNKIKADIKNNVNKLSENELRSAYGYLSRFDVEKSPFYLIGKIENTQRKQSYNLPDDHISVWYKDDGTRMVVYPFLDGRGHKLAKTVKLKTAKEKYIEFITFLKDRGVEFA